jgi:cell division protein FtsL
MTGMRLFDQFGKKKNTPVKSAPVISRGGKIGRVSVEDLSSGKKSQKLLEEKVENPAVEDGYAISDRGFVTATERKASKRSQKRRFFTVKSKEKNPFPVMTVLFCAICTVLFMSMIVNLVEINEYTKDVASLQKHVETLHKEREELSAELSDKESIETLRQYMEENGGNLGMVESDKMKPPVAITPDKDGQIEDYDVPESEEAMVTVVLNALAKNLADTWNKFVG